MTRPSIAGRPDHVRADIRQFEDTLARFQAGQVAESTFLEFRLRHGVYGQRQDGVHMMRSKLPLGLLGADQLDAFADLTHAYASGVAHLTTRQDIQVHFVPLAQTPDLMRVLARAELTAREACGNVVRNVCATPLAGVSPHEAFDVTPHGMALARFLLRHPDGQSLGRKFKVTFAGSADRAFNLTAIHDLGLTATVNGDQRGFIVDVGGGLGAVPHEAQRLTDFLPEAELLPLTLAIVRVFARHGEKNSRARARMKFLVARWGIARFRAEVDAERARLAFDPTWTQHLRHPDPIWTDRPLHGPAPHHPAPEGPDVWLQKQHGYAVVKARVPRGDLSPEQLRAVAHLLRTHTGDTLRIGWDQSLYIRQVPFDRVDAVRTGLSRIGLGGPRPGGLADPVTCPGADTCKLGITSPRAVARQVQDKLQALARTSPRLAALRIHISGCPNSCAQHQLADIGFFGAARTRDGVTAPHYMVLVGGEQDGRVPGPAPLGTGFSTTIIKLPAARLATAVERLSALYLQHAEPDETAGSVFRRLGRATIRSHLTDLRTLPSPLEAPELYREHGRSEPFAVVRGTGECAGAVVLGADLLLMEADQAREQLRLAVETHAPGPTVHQRALAAMTLAARALLDADGQTNPADIVHAFRRTFYDTGRILEGVGFYLLEAHAEPAESVSGDRIRRLVIEADLFVEEAHAALGRLRNPSRGVA